MLRVETTAQIIHASWAHKDSVKFAGCYITRCTKISSSGCCFERGVAQPDLPPHLIHVGHTRRAVNLSLRTWWYIMCSVRVCETRAPKKWNCSVVVHWRQRRPGSSSLASALLVRPFNFIECLATTEVIFAGWIIRARWALACCLTTANLFCRARGQERGGFSIN